MAEIETVADLAAAYKDGRLDPETDKLWLDNDDTHVATGDDEDPSSWKTVFSLDPHDVLEQSLDALGIPWEHV